MKFNEINFMNQQEELEALAILIHDLRKYKKLTLAQLAQKIERSVGPLNECRDNLVDGYFAG